MARRPLYSRSGSTRVMRAGSASTGPTPSSAYMALSAAEPEEIPLRKQFGGWWSTFRQRNNGKLLVASAVAVALLLGGAYELLRAPTQNLTQADINDAVNFALEERGRPPSVASLSYGAVIPAVVRVNGFDPRKPANAPTEPYGAPETPAPDGDANKAESFHEEFTAVGTGVVIDDEGTILTNLHVANAAPRIKVQFHDGTEADAMIIGARPDLDLAILKPRVLPDDLKPAALGNSAALVPGDEVTAIGFPFGIGPSASFGIVSQLLKVQGEARDGEEAGGHTMIQFDAAANPGNSGGPLINANGEVVGIVTSIMNPSGIRTFAGIGFATTIEAAASAAGDSPL